MYTRCPHCHTVFRLTAAQLKSHGGQVRCGRCQKVFQADQHLVDAPRPASSKPASPPRKRAPRKAAPSRAASTPPTRENEIIVLETPSQPVAPEPATKTVPLPIFRAQPAQTRSIFWMAGIVALLGLLMAQGVVFYGQAVVRAAPWLREPVAFACTALPCQRLAPIDMRKLDLVESQVTPHPRYDRALRIRATLVNRGEEAQPFPLLEVSLTNRKGQLIARRTYKPSEYLPIPKTVTDGMPPQVAIQAQLDITSPGPQASGFEILLVPPTE